MFNVYPVLIIFTVFIFGNYVYFQPIFAIITPSSTNNPVNSSYSLNSSNTSSLSNTKHNNLLIKAGGGNSTVSFTQYYPSYVEINAGDSVTWYNGIDVPNPHTVTFFKDLDNLEKIGVPFYVQNNTQFEPVINNLGEPIEEVSKSGIHTIMLLNSRALSPTVITSNDTVLHLGKDPMYNFNGDEKFVNSGPLLSLSKKQNFDYFFTNSFTIIFNKPGFFEYSCLFHPWMVGKILVKP